MLVNKAKETNSMTRGRLVTASIILLALVALAIGAWLYRQQQLNEPLSEWDRSVETNAERINHDDWQVLLDDFLDTEDERGVFLFDYESLQIDAEAELDGYINYLTSLDPRDYSRNEQFAYWINLYNAATVDLIVNHFPVDSITDLGETALAFGPWDDPIVTIAGISLSLNNIEHGILRPIFKDPRIHFAVNCASIGCPNLQPQAFTSENLEELLHLGSQEFVSHPRALSADDDTLYLSSIFDWYAEDFGDETKAVLNKIAEYATEDAANILKDYEGDIEYHYDWTLNSADF